MTVLLRTIHGSRLYGLAHPGSDTDWYTVVSETTKTRHRVVDGVDTTVVGFDTFYRQILCGVPQALEALFSPYDTVGGLDWLRRGFHAVGPDVFDRYRRTICSFALDPRDDGGKRLRHAHRLTIGLDQLMRTGRLNPALTVTQIRSINDLTARHIFPWDVPGAPITPPNEKR